MRAFAIKNKEGKYKTSCSEYINSLWQADIFDDYELALCYCLDSEKPVEVTIAEGDLQQQLAEMTEKYNACQEARKLEAEFNSQDKKELKQQLAEKDKEIKQYREKEIIDMNYKEMLELQLAKADKEIEKQQAQVEIWKKKVFGKMETQLLGVTKDKINEIRHQVCEKIKHKLAEKRLPMYFKDVKDVLNYPRKAVCWEDVVLILGQIEKGE